MIGRNPLLTATLDKPLAKVLALTQSSCPKRGKGTLKSGSPSPKLEQGGFIQGNEKHDVVDSPKLSGLVEQCAIPAFLLT